MAQFSRLVIKTGVNHWGILSTSLLLGLPGVLVGLYVLIGAFQNLSAIGLMFGFVIVSVGLYVVLSRHRVTLDRNRQKVICRWNILLWSQEKEHDWDQCTAVEVEELLPYMNTPSGRRPLLVLRGEDAGFQEPNVGKEGTTYFSVGIVCGDEMIPLKEFGFARKARRLAGKVGEYMELPIQDRAL